MSLPDYSGRTLDNKYQLKRLLGQGGMGFVYQGEHLVIGRQVAVKFLHRDLATNKEVITRFYREARAAASIAHRNIIDVLDVGVTPEGEPYLVMEYLKGEGLASLLERKTRLSLSAACAIMEPALSALGAAHQKEVIHRDLKPDNIFLMLQDGQGEPEVKLIDFGISKLQTMDDQVKLTQEGSTLGTPAYMSPEQAKGSAHVNHLTDIYSMGVIFYEMLTGTTPFEGEQYNELFYNILTAEPRPPHEVCEDFPQQAWPVIQRALSKEPADRFQSAEEMLAAIKELASAEELKTGLTVLGQKIKRDSIASGSLGPSTKVTSDPYLAADLLSRLSRGDKPISWGSMPKTAYHLVKRKLTVDPKRRIYRISFGLGMVLLIALTGTGLCSSDTEGDGVSITIKGAPKNAKIYYDDSLVLTNPFRVERKDTLVPLRVEAPKKKNVKISIVPTEDQIVDVKLMEIQTPPEKIEPKEASAEQTETQGKKDVPQDRQKGSAEDKEKAAEKGDKKGTAKKKRKNPLRRITNSLRRTFSKD